MDPINAFASSKGLGQLESIKSFDVSTTDMQRFERALNEPGLHAASELQPGTDTRGSGELSTIGELENPTVSTQSIGGAFIESIQDIKSTLDARARTHYEATQYARWQPNEPSRRDSRPVRTDANEYAAGANQQNGG